MTILKKPKRLVAQLMPSVSYIWKVKSGNTEPIVYLANPFAATADAPFMGPYVSMIYIAPAMKIARLPRANGMPANTGDIQWTDDLAVQANQNKLDTSQ